MPSAISCVFHSVVCAVLLCGAVALGAAVHLNENAFQSSSNFDRPVQQETSRSDHVALGMGKENLNSAENDAQFSSPSQIRDEILQPAVSASVLQNLRMRMFSVLSPQFAFISFFRVPQPPSGGVVHIFEIVDMLTVTLLISKSLLHKFWKPPLFGVFANIERPNQHKQ